MRKRIGKRCENPEGRSVNAFRPYETNATGKRTKAGRDLKHTGKQLELTPRLQLLADWTPDGASFADIGADHAFLPVWLLLRGRTRRCIASDLRPGPLRRARETAQLWNVSEISFRLCDGLSGIGPDEADVIAIAGLGGENIAAILSKAPWTKDGRHTLLLQPMTRAETLRRFLSENGYAIRREALARERDILYPVMEVAGGEMRLTAGQCYGGAKLLYDPLGDRYLIEKILRLQNALAGLNRGARSATRRDNAYQETASATDSAANPEKASALRDANQEKAEELRDILTELYAMREEWRHANRPGN